jgi:hypothetical protein
MKKETYFAGAMGLALLSSGSAIGAAASDTPPVGPVDGVIGYILTDEVWAVYQTPEGKQECPDGLNAWGPREQFKMMFVDDGKKRTLEEAQLAWEAKIWFPEVGEDTFPFRGPVGNVSYGLNLDGRIDPDDQISPDGVKGVDNQLYRAIGCIEEFRGPTGILHFLVNRYLRDFEFNRVLIELSGVDDMINDSEVTVTILRGRDRMMADATGNNIIPGGSNRVDLRWGRKYVQKLKGKIIDGVLTTEAEDIKLPHAIFNSIPGEDELKGAVFSLKLTAERAEGLIAGYSDIDTWYRQLNHSWSTHHQSYGQLSSPSLYKQMHRLADGYPDPETGKNTAISSALAVKFTQVFIQHPPKEVADGGVGGVSSTGIRASQ